MVNWKFPEGFTMQTKAKHTIKHTKKIYLKKKENMNIRAL